jgi:serine/threonine protein kinase/HEAT repeat protein
VGERLGKYLVTEKLGEGGMGVVFAGVHEALGREVAIKLLRAELSRNPQLVPRFQAEAEAVSRIGHANIVAVYDFGRLEDGSLYYVMERIRGRNMAERLAQGPLERDEAVAIFGQICRALQATHAKKIVHRDLKPDNVLLQYTRPGQPPLVKVLDYGIAKIRGDDQQKNLTAVGMLMGTPAYMAPEQVTAAHSVDGRADLYSLGAMLYQTLTGAPPFMGEPMVVLTKHVSEAPVPPSQRAQVSPALEAVVLKALAKDPAQRQPDAMTFLAELEAAWPKQVQPATFVPQAPVAPVSSPPAPSPVAPSSSSPGKLGWLAIPVGVIAAGAAAFFLWQKPKPPPPVVEDQPLKALTAALAGDVSSRRLALEEIGDSADRAALPLVTAALDDANPEVRRAAAQAAAAVGKSGDTALVGALAAAGQRSGGALALEIFVARLRLGDASVVGDLQRALSAKAGDPMARLRAATAMAEKGRIKAPQLHAAIAAAPAAKRALKWPAYAQLFQLGDDANFARELEAAIKGKDPVARIDAAQTLARSGDPDGKSALAEIARNGSAQDRLDAASVLAELGDDAAAAQLVATLADPQLRAQAACALGRAHFAGARAPLQTMLGDHDSAARLAAAASLQSLGSTP